MFSILCTCVPSILTKFMESAECHVRHIATRTVHSICDHRKRGFFYVHCCCSITPIGHIGDCSTVALPLCTKQRLGDCSTAALHCTSTDLETAVLPLGSAPSSGLVTTALALGHIHDCSTAAPPLCTAPSTDLATKARPLGRSAPSSD